MYNKKLSLSTKSFSNVTFLIPFKPRGHENTEQWK